MNAKSRTSNIELLRLLAAIGVISVHYIYPHAVTGMKDSGASDFSLFSISLIESIFAPAVNVFILISGYFLCNKKSINISKPLNLLLQLIIFRELLNVVLFMLPYTNVSIGTFCRNLLPQSYFVILYISLYLISPYLNIVIKSLNPKGFTNLILLIFFLYSCYPIMWDLINEFTSLNITAVSTIGHWGNQCGHTITHFVLMYCIGAYLRNSTIINKYSKTINPLSVWMIITFLMAVAIYYEFERGVPIIDSAILSYTNPLIILQSICLLLIFRNFKIQSAVVNNVAKLGFITYIIHGKIFSILQIDTYVRLPFPTIIVHLIVTILFTFIVSYILNLAYNLTINKVVHKLANKEVEYYQ